MPAYVYPISIERERKTITYYDTHTIESDELRISDIESIVGDCPFTIERVSSIDDFYSIRVKKERMETDKEYTRRIEKAEAYMSEYYRRKAQK